MADQKGSDYIVLWRAKEDDAWTELGKVTAGSEPAAKNEALGKWKPEGGWVVACPSRSWKPENKQPELRFR